MRGIGALLTLAATLAFTCSTGATEILVSQYNNDPSGAPYAIALNQGFFKKRGIDITAVVSGAGGGASVRSAIATDLGYGDVAAAPVIAAAEHNEDVKIIGITSRSLADLVVVVMQNSPLRTVADLKGKKFGISNPKSLGEIMGVLLLEKEGLRLSDVQMVSLGSLTGALTALENGVVDVTVMPVVLFHMRGGESKYRVLVNPRDLPPVPSQIAMATGSAIKTHPGQLRAIMAARRDGTDFIYQHTDQAVSILAKVYQPLPATDVAKMVKALARAKFWSEGRIEMSLLTNTMHAMQRVGMFEKNVDLANVVDNSFLPADLQK